MKKISKIMIALLAIFTLFSLSSCKVKDDSKIHVVSTIFPEYDWTKELTKDSSNIKLELINDQGVDFHSFQPSVDDIVSISKADIFIYVGGESDEWVDDALKNKKNKDMIILNLLDLLGDKAKEEETKEGMESEEEEEAELDEHVWLSIKNAKFFVEKIKDALVSVDKDNKDLYETNYNSYLNKLNELDNKYEESLKNAKTKTLLFADRFPFLYLLSDYNIDYFAAFKGCSTESEASFETITFLVNKANELNIKYLIVVDRENSISTTIKNNTNTKDQEIIMLYSMQTVSKDSLNKASYLSYMEDNLENIKVAVL